MQNIKIHVLDGDPVLRPHSQLIKKMTVDALKKIAKYIDILNVDIVIIHSPENIAFGRISGQAPNKYRVNVALNVKHKHFKKNLKIDLHKTLAHELYHTVRSQKNGYSKTLVEDFIDEGLADNFEIEVSGGKPPAYCMSSKKSSLKNLIRKAKKEFFSTNYDRDDWFYGSKTKNIPRFAGYIIGYFLIKKFLELNPHIKPSQLVQKKAKSILAAVNNLI